MKTRWCHVTFCTVIILFTGSDANFSPNVTVKSCDSQRVVVQLENAAEGGLIFIQGRGLTCSKRTTSEKRNYEFDFETCKIEYDSKFRVVIQKDPMYQTGHDKVIPVMCIVDTSDLFVSGLVFPEESLNTNLFNKTIRPSVSMRIKAPETEGTLTEVTLNENILLSLKLDDPYLEDFDIKAKNCRAELINLIENECSTDEELFPNFEKKTKGDVTSSFKAFQPTNLYGHPEVDVAFTCTVAVCKGECHEKLCGAGRKKRDGDEVDEDEIYEKVTCATKLKVKTPEQDYLGGLTSKLEGKLCAEKVAVASVLAVTILTLIVSWIVCACVASKLRRVTRLTDEPSKPSTLRRLSEKNINLARSVGRRLSSMLNMPVGYNIREPKMMHESIPETDPSPPSNRRRDSVTVSNIINLETTSFREDGDLDIILSEKSEPIYENLRTTTSSKSVILRRRFVERGVQTVSNVQMSPEKRSDKGSQLNSKKTPFGFITSISIKSGLSKPKTGSADMSNTVSHANSDFDLDVNQCYVNTAMEESVIDYSFEDVPKARYASRPEHCDVVTQKIEPDYEMARKASLNDAWIDDLTVNSSSETNEPVIRFRNQHCLTGRRDDFDVYENISGGVEPDSIKIVPGNKLQRKDSINV